MGSLPLTEDFLPDDIDTLDIRTVANRLGVSTGRVRNLITDHHLLAVSRDGEPAVPALFLSDDGIAKHLTGLIDVLIDGGYSRHESMRWLFTDQEDLGVCPAVAIHGHQAREVIRRAQAQAF